MRFPENRLCYAKCGRKLNLDENLIWENKSKNVQCVGSFYYSCLHSASLVAYTYNFLVYFPVPSRLRYVMRFSNFLMSTLVPYTINSFSHYFPIFVLWLVNVLHVAGTMHAVHYSYSTRKIEKNPVFGYIFLFFFP